MAQRWDVEKPADKEKKTIVRPKGESEPIGYIVSIGGPHDVYAKFDDRIKSNRDLLGGWCIGDIDFDEDGAVFIRNPYLANAIERQLEKNAKGGPKGDRDKPFKLVRDRGFSGEKVNIVC